MKKEEVGSIRILTKDLSTVEKTKQGWKRVKIDIPKTFTAIKLFKNNNYLKALIDTKSPKFLKGGLTPQRSPYGERINVLPSKHKLDKAYSLFAKDLTIHDESSNTHWDVIFLNPNKKYSYLYTLEKKQKNKNLKYSAVRDFEKNINKINKVINQKIKDKNDLMALAIKTLLQTKMRVGNEIYNKTNKHKGLTTLKKHDIKINGLKVTFSYISKDGVPQKTTTKFSKEYISGLKKILKKTKTSDFVFTNKFKRPLKDQDFKKAFKDYCGEEFYPHIVRSHYATKTAEQFLKKHKKATKKEINKLFTDIAEKLGHKKYSKNDCRWKTDYNATIHYYIKPTFVEKILQLGEK